ncbi:channel protein, MIP family [Oesophagostomum dentatum]|uniref:Channel protein, MIP family n=1 Tax=Oesophagostomum dentatum TaxID=61180 RepID=A0A0B1RYA4_OESDE|nr:channel protein, MIP family [Oesophagostomum dentatum]
MAEVMLPEDRLRQKIQIHDPTIRNALAEFLGTALLLFIGIGIVMQLVLSEEKLNTWIQINVGWGFAITFCVYTCSKASGGHLNPAVSFAFYTLGKLSLKNFFVYSAAQTLGAFVGTVGAYGIYYDQFIHYAGDLRTLSGPKSTGICFCSFPPAHVSNTTAFFDQLAGTAILMFFVVVVLDKRIGIPGPAHATLIGFVIMMIGMSMGMNVGYPINPARDLGPRIFMLFLGYGSAAFT